MYIIILNVGENFKESIDVAPSSLPAPGIRKSTNPNPAPSGAGFGFAACGGGGGSRTPVRKRFLGNLSGRRRSITFPYPDAGRQTSGLGSFIVHGALKALRTHVHHSSTPHPGPWSFRVGRPLIKQRRERRYRCSLIYKLPVFRMSGTSARYSRPHVPVETSTPPRCRKVRSIRDAQAWASLISLPCSSASRRTRLRWAPAGDGRLHSLVGTTIPVCGPAVELK